MIKIQSCHDTYNNDNDSLIEQRIEFHLISKQQWGVFCCAYMNAVIYGSVGCWWCDCVHMCMYTTCIK